MFRTLIWFILFWLYQLYALILGWKLKRLEQAGKKEEAYNYLHSIAMAWAQSMVRNTGSSIIVKGEENIPQDGAVLFVSNHQANFDIPILLGYLDKPKGFVAKVELQKLPMVSNWMRKIQCVFLDRQDIRKSLQAINEAINILKNGHSMVIFPEGTRSKSSQMGEFKKGSLKLALKAKVPVVPVTINGSYRIMGANGLLIQPAKVEIVVGAPLYLEKLTEEEKSNLAELVREKIAENLKEKSITA